MTTIQKRLHISGLTPAITLADLNSRLRGFGDVRALDGFGALDAVGQPRKFAYVTLEATESNLSRCLNVLSGTIWKGAKLRIGEAKPDYPQRLEAERKRAAEAAAEEHPSKRRRLPRGVHGVHADEMTPVDVDNVGGRPGWHKTALSHLIRPMKMRPSHPLPAPTLNTIPKDSGSKSKKSRKEKPSRADAPTRARVRTIDPRMYGSVHLRENMLENIVVDPQGIKASKPRSLSPSNSDKERIPEEERQVPPPPPARELHALPSPQNLDASFNDIDLAEEKQRGLELLKNMFGDEGSEWGGQESVASELDARVDDAKDNTVHTESDITIENADKEQSDVASVPPHSQNPQLRSLKDMFKPHEEEAGYSLLSGLGEIDIDPSFDLDFGSTAPAPTATAMPIHAQKDTHITQPLNITSALTLNPALPLFFPQPENPRAKDLFTVSRAEGWEFGRSGDSETIRQRWDASKRSLTQQWKKRAREAVKSRKRRYGAAEEVA